MRIGILQTGHAPDELLPITGDVAPHFERMLDGFGFDFATYSVVDMEFPDSITDCDGWLITGSKFGAYEDIDFIPPLETFIRDVYAADIPLVGICFGHQIIAQALGGKVEKFAGGWSVGRQTYNWNGETLALNAWHQDQVTQVPEGAEVVASTDFCANAPLLYDDRAFTVQPHPEFPDSVVETLIAVRGHLVAPERVAAARSHLNQPNDNRRIADWLAERNL